MGLVVLWRRIVHQAVKQSIEENQMLFLIIMRVKECLKLPYRSGYAYNSGKEILVKHLSFWRKSLRNNSK
jgi:hypothetical protein